ncbi:protein LYRIC isoform X2 [Vombatus ursinus]|uniref:Metadherin n=1 Tax=Vombatus ursinus TaxID=29139 RepID=A0A4X2KG13_VOMUR|nr:protein LYRIC isoform X2 [Vombatus ursinus]
MAAEAARSWLDALAQQAEEGSAPLRELLSAGLYLLRTELGLDLGLEPHSYPAWVILLGTAALGLLLLLLLGLGWAAACSGARQRRRSPPRRREEVPAPAPAPEDGALLKSLRSEDSRKKNRKRVAEKPKPNGRTVPQVPEEEVITSPRREAAKQQQQPQPQQQQQQQQQLDAEKKNEKLKKNKKKSKSEVKAVQNSSRHDGKEVDEGAWETKVSNREKRQQRKRDKVQPDTGPLDPAVSGIESAYTVTTEQLITASFPVGSRKNKGLNENPTVNGGSWNEKSIKIPSQISAGEEKWTSVSSASAGKRKIEPSIWGQDTGDTSANGKDWGVSLVGRTWGERSLFPGTASCSGNVDRRVNNSTEQNSAPFPSLALTTAVSGSTAEVSQSTASDFQWDVSRNQPHIDDEWSGLNGLSSADPSSDWNAPAEEWGNWVDEEKSSFLKSQELVHDEKFSDDDKEKEDVPLQSSASGKSKKKKKKKKKQSEETNSPAQDTEELEKEFREDFPMETSKVHPKQKKDPSLKTMSTSDPPEVLIKSSQPVKTLPLAVSTEPSVILSQNESDKIPSQVPQTLQETAVSKPNLKQNSVPPSQTKSEASWESPKQVKKKKKARRET